MPRVVGGVAVAPTQSRRRAAFEAGEALSPSARKCSRLPIRGGERAAQERAGAPSGSGVIPPPVRSPDRTCGSSWGLAPSHDEDHHGRSNRRDSAATDASAAARRALDDRRVVPLNVGIPGTNDLQGLELLAIAGQWTGGPMTASGQRRRREVAPLRRVKRAGLFGGWPLNSRRVALLPASRDRRSNENRKDDAPDTTPQA